MQVTTRYSSTIKRQLTLSHLSALAFYQEVSLCLVVFSATHNVFSRFRQWFISTTLKHWELCEVLNTIVGEGIWYDTFQVQNTKWLRLVNYIVTTINSDNVLCASFGLYPSYVAGILNSVKEINFYVLCDKYKNCAKYI